MASKYGHFEVCQLIVEGVEDKNSKDGNGETPLHMAATYSHLEVCWLIVENVEDKNPEDKFGKTPLHMAAEYGHMVVCQLIVENVRDKNPEDNGETPLNPLRFEGHQNFMHHVEFLKIPL